MRRVLAGSLGLLAIVAFAGCGWLPGAGEDATAASRTIEVAALPEGAPYPELRTVPPRPQLSYSVEQRREVVDSLISDREHARYTRHLVRYRTGRTSMPPPTPPEIGDAAAAAPGLAPDPPAETTAARRVGDVGYGDDDGDADGGLGDFMRTMVRDAETEEEAPDEAPSSDDADVGPGADASAPGAGPAAVAHAAGTPPRVGVVSRGDGPGAGARDAAGGTAAIRMSAFAPRPLLKPGAARTPPAPEQKSAVRKAAAKAAVEGDRSQANGPPGPRVIRFAARSAELPADAEAVLEDASATARARGAAVVVTGRGEPMALALDRAYTVAVGLLRHGMSASEIVIGAKADPGAHRVELVVDGDDGPQRGGPSDRGAKLAGSPRHP